VEITCRCDRKAAIIARVYAIEAEAVTPVERRQVDVGRETSALAEHHVGVAGSGIGEKRADDQVIEPVAVDVAGRRDRKSAVVTKIGTIEPEAIRPVEQR